ncbi:DUF1810 domain-containing protein [Nakamurella deserti]|uniref:DUF1810 domain-containing protein n=1 Tax=Nakamurella deserti TaxID=2164074 RepID=UPI000DBEA747|nr:DUF1810 domain-containing protein [Nakamurella deserti]
MDVAEPAPADRFDLDRFVVAQEGTYEQALAEVRRGRKTGHWMWFVFPQIAGLGRSPMAQRYAIGSLDEARAYLAHPVLGHRLREVSQALADLPPDASADGVLGGIDAVKLRSSMTLFARADPAEPVFAAALDRFYRGSPDAATDRLLAPT